ncbi:MAG TPA: histidinol-phosphatase [Kiritimatiellia bacterium]|nr:histidinol-phosphatase [Kiritimatiellia bacterium]
MTSARAAAWPPDYHTHNHLCKHAEGVPLDYALAAGRHGVPHLAATDHCPTDDRYGNEHRMTLDQFEIYLDFVVTAQKNSPVPVLLGVEADYYRGCERFLRPWLQQHPIDLVLGSVHFLNYWGHPTEPRGLSEQVDPALIWQLYFQRVAELADTRLYDVVAHLDLPKRFGHALPLERLREYALPALDRIAAAGMAIEINTSGLHHPPRECYPGVTMLTWARERGVGLVFGSDSHSPRRVGDGFDVALRMARDAGFTTSRHYAARAHREVPLPEIPHARDTVADAEPPA